MPHTTTLSWGDVHNLALRVAPHLPTKNPVVWLYPVPRGGIYAAMAVQHAARCNGLDIMCRITAVPETADVIIDDIIDSGKTKLEHQIFQKPFLALINKFTGEYRDTWVVFPWEEAQKENGPQENIRRILEYVGEDPNREGLKETPDRVVRSYSELFAGYKQNPADLFKTFEEHCDEMVVLRNIPFTSMCEHHMQPFRGVAHVGYIPQSRVVGLSKLARLVECFARRLQVQERLCQQVTEAMDGNLKPKGSACVMEAEHFCMSCRGVNKPGVTTVTSSLTGVFRDKPEARAEFLSIIRG